MPAAATRERNPLDRGFEAVDRVLPEPVLRLADVWLAFMLAFTVSAFSVVDLLFAIIFEVGDPRCQPADSSGVFLRTGAARGAAISGR
jgi:hypothetical protein